MTNNKFIYKLIYNLYILLGYNIPQEKIIQIVTDDLKCLTEKEKNIKEFSDSFNYLFDNLNQYFDSGIIKRSYYLLTNDLLDNDITKNIVNIYYQNIDNSVHTLSSMVHLYIVNHVKKRNIEFAFLISNCIMKKKNRGFLMPYEYSHSEYKIAVKNNDLSSLIKVIFEIEQIDKKTNPCKLSKAEIIDKIRNLKNELINKFNIRKLYLFGSFAKGKNNESSDVDFLVILEESLINVERLDRIDEIKAYLNGVLCCNIDILDFTYAISNLGVNEIENVITLI